MDETTTTETRAAGTDVDVAIIGGGPAGSALGGLLAMDGHRVLIVEKDVHPRDHVGESMVPANNFIMHRLGFLPKMEAAGFVHKQGVGWTAPRGPIWNLVCIRTSDFPPPDAVQTYSYNVERDQFDALLLRHAHELGAKVLQGVTVRKVLMDGDRAAGVRIAALDEREQDVTARLVVDASGRRCMLARQLQIQRVHDAELNQHSIWTWFRGVEDAPPGYEGMVIFHFLDLERAWGWQIPLRNGVSSIGVVTAKEDFQKSGKTPEEFFDGLIARSRTFKHIMRNAERIRPWVIEADYSYQLDRVAGPGWLLVGDAMRFVDPIFSSGMDVALYSASFAYDAIVKSWNGVDEQVAFDEYAATVTDGVDVWYETTDIFYRLQALCGRYAMDKRYREDIARSLQGNPYAPVNRDRARRLLADMRNTYEQVMADPNNLMRPGALLQAAPVQVAASAEDEPAAANGGGEAPPADVGGSDMEGVGSRVEVAGRLLEFMKAELLPPETASSVKADTPLLDGLLDSFGLMQIATFLEDRYDIVVEPEDMSAEHFLNVQRIEEYVRKKTAAA
jgi:FADH2 O2-dependent halogenase